MGMVPSGSNTISRNTNRLFGLDSTVMKNMDIVFLS